MLWLSILRLKLNKSIQKVIGSKFQRISNRFFCITYRILNPMQLNHHKLWKLSHRLRYMIVSIRDAFKHNITVLFCSVSKAICLAVARDLANNGKTIMIVSVNGSLVAPLPGAIRFLYPHVRILFPIPLCLTYGTYINSFPWTPVKHNRTNQYSIMQCTLTRYTLSKNRECAFHLSRNAILICFYIVISSDFSSNYSCEPFINIV